MMDFIFNTIVWNPSISPFSIFGFEVRYYSLCWVIALLSSYYVVKMTYKKSGVGEDKFEPLFMYCFIGILIGARLGHCLFYEPEYYLVQHHIAQHCRRQADLCNMFICVYAICC